jgi:hypothetical protein
VLEVGAVSEDFRTVRDPREEEGWEHREDKADDEHLSWFGFESRETQNFKMRFLTFPHALIVGGAALMLFFSLRKFSAKPKRGFICLVAAAEQGNPAEPVNNSRVIPRAAAATPAESAAPQYPPPM